MFLGYGPVMIEATLSVSELGTVIKAVLDTAMPDGVWVQGEISGINRHKNGHVYFDLVERSDEAGARPVATIPVVLWRGNKERVNRLLQNHGNAIRMDNGVAVRIQGSVDYWPGGGRLQFQMKQIDPTYTLGKMVADRDVLIAKLEAEKVLKLNSLLPMPDVPLHIALVTSIGSAAESDVLKVLGASGLAFRVAEIHSAVQGEGAQHQIAAAIAAAAETGADAIVVARGGGSKTDLMAFDHESVARAIIASSLPVITGIGHQVDHSVADEVAHTACATPTAAANHLVETVAAWLDRLSLIEAGILAAATRAGDVATAKLNDLTTRISLTQRHAIKAAELKLDSVAARVNALDPAVAMQRGWSITRSADGEVVRSIHQVEMGATVITEVADGSLSSTITSSEPMEDPT